MKPTILLLEDEQFDADWISKILEEEGYAVIHAMNGDDVKERIEKDGKNILMALLDMKIDGNPEQNFGEEIAIRRGVAAAKYLEQHLRPIPVIFASSFGREDVKKQAEEANYTGPWAYFDKEVLRDRQHDVLREAVRLAIQNYEAYEDESLDKGEILTIKRPSGGIVFNFNVKNNDEKLFYRYLYKKQELDCIRSLGGGVFRIFISNGDKFDVSMTPSQFRKQYEAILKIYNESDFLIEGISNGNTIWINYDNVRAYNGQLVRFETHEVAINSTLKHHLDTFFFKLGAKADPSN